MQLRLGETADPRRRNHRALFVGGVEVGYTNRDNIDISHSHGFSTWNKLKEAIPVGATVLDIGSGESNFLDTLSRQRQDVDCVNFDLSYCIKECVEALSQTSKGRRNLHYVGGDMRRLPFDHGTFDVIFSSSALPYLEPAERKVALGQAYDVLKFGGTMYIYPWASSPEHDNYLSWTNIYVKKLGTENVREKLRHNLARAGLAARVNADAMTDKDVLEIAKIGSIERIAAGIPTFPNYGTIPPLAKDE